jgi:lipoprotein Spr
MAFCLSVKAIEAKFAPSKNMIRGLLKYLMILLLFSSCTGLKNLFQPVPVPVHTPRQNSPFIEDISINHDASPASLKSTNSTSSLLVKKDAVAYNSSLELLSSIQFKYAIQLNVPVETLTNTSLYNLIDEWLHTPYRYGGTSKRGIDCSAFVQTLMLGAFTIQLPRIAREQHHLTSPISAHELREGDLVFFNTRGGVSHVGVYLHNNKFVHASTSNGVMISDLNDDYWRRKFIGAGRVLQPIMP